MPIALKAVLALSGIVTILYVAWPGPLVATAATAAKSLF
jgi:hypothetical protein